MLYQHRVTGRVEGARYSLDLAGTRADPLARETGPLSARQMEPVARIDGRYRVQSAATPSLPVSFTNPPAASFASQYCAAPALDGRQFHLAAIITTNGVTLSIGLPSFRIHELVIDLR